MNPPHAKPGGNVKTNAEALAAHSQRTIAGRSLRQHGFSLVMVMIIMVVVSLLGVAASQMVLMGERSARFDRDWQIAYQAAEAALLDAEFDIRGPNPDGNSRVAQFANDSRAGFIPGCGTSGAERGLCKSTATGVKPAFYSVDFSAEGANAPSVRFGEFTGRTMASNGVAGRGAQSERLPRYIIEDIPDQPPGTSASNRKVLYRVTAVGFGPRKETQAVLQMFFRKE